MIPGEPVRRNRNDRIRANRKKNGKSGRAVLIALILAVIVAAAVLFINSLPRERHPVMKTERPLRVERHRLPPHEGNKGESVPNEAYTTTFMPEREDRPRHSGAGRLAIIVDDMGKGVQEARSLMDIGVPVTFAVIPGLPKVRQVAQEARNRGIETIVHIPMEPKGYPEHRLEENGLLLTQSDEEIAGRVNGYLREIPQAVGANNHMGSAFTENREKMSVVLRVLKERGLFFVDSKTSPNSVGYGMARELGVRTASRAVFLDNIKEGGYIAGQVRQAAAIARRKGSAIAICHPHPVTIQTLAAELPRLKEEGLDLVSVSSLVR